MAAASSRLATSSSSNTSSSAAIHLSSTFLGRKAGREESTSRPPLRAGTASQHQGRHRDQDHRAPERLQQQVLRESSIWLCGCTTLEALEPISHLVWIFWMKNMYITWYSSLKAAAKRALGLYAPPRPASSQCSPATEHCQWPAHWPRRARCRSHRL